MMDEQMDKKQNDSGSFGAESQFGNLTPTGVAYDAAGNVGQSDGDMNLDDLTDWLNRKSENQNQDPSENSNEDETEEETEEETSQVPDNGVLPADVDVKTGKRQKKGLPVKKPVLITGIALLVLIAVYGIGCIFYSSHFFNRAWINNEIDAANCSVDSVIAQLKNDADSHVLTLTKRDQTTAELKGKDFDYQYDDNGTIQQALATQNCWKWPVSIFSDTTYTVTLGYKYDDTKLQTAIDALDLNAGGTAEAPVDAHPAWQNGTVEIVPEVYGSTIISDKLNAVVRESLNKGEKSLILTTAGVYETPTYTSSSPEVAAAKTAMEKAAQSTLTYTIDDAQEFLDVNTFGPWLTCDENMNVTVDQAQGAAYLATLGQKYDTTGGEYNFTTSGGAKIVVNGVTYGWYVNEAAELPLMTADILSGDQVTRAITSKGATSRDGARTVGDTYVEVSLSAQHMWLYVNGSCLVSTDVVTGSPNHSTPTGVFKIESHSRNEHLIGTNDDGSKYDSFVYYWMPFYHPLGDGLHDADSWRNAYGGNIYLTNGSHGCVNTPLDAVATIYENTSDGCPVVIY